MPLAAHRPCAAWASCLLALLRVAVLPNVGCGAELPCRNAQAEALAAASERISELLTCLGASWRAAAAAGVVGGRAAASEDEDAEEEEEGEDAGADEAGGGGGVATRGGSPRSGGSGAPKVGRKMS